MDTFSPEAVFILVSFFATVLFAVVALFYAFGPTPKTPPPEPEPPTPTSMMNEIMRVLDNQKSSIAELSQAVDDFFRHYDDLELSDYKKKAFFFALIIHQNVTPDLILKVDEDLKAANPHLFSELNKVLTRGLDNRDMKSKRI